MIKTINAIELNKLMQQEEIFLLDVREQNERAAAAIMPSAFMPLSAFNPLKLDISTDKVIVYCRSGKRSLAACEILKEHYPDIDIYNLENGILGWADAGFKIHLQTST